MEKKKPKSLPQNLETGRDPRDLCRALHHCVATWFSSNFPEWDGSEFQREGSSMADGNHLTVRLNREGCEPCECSVPVSAIPWEMIINLAMQALIAYLNSQKKVEVPTPPATPVKPR